MSGAKQKVNRRALIGRALAAVATTVGLASIAASCTGEATTAEVRSLERTGEIALICLGAPDSGQVLRPLSDCTSTIYDSPNDFGPDGTVPHLYALVTLEQRGEVAMIDLSTEERNVLDQEPSTPGETPLPVGALPTSIVATEKGTAVFVTSADVRLPGIYALPGNQIRPCEVDPVRCEEPIPTISTWPACRLDDVPGELVIVTDAPVGDTVRPSCAAPTEFIPFDTSGPKVGDIDAEGLGRQKLYVTLPNKGTLAVIDAQTLLSAPAGSFDPCVIEAEVPLSAIAPEVSSAEFAIAPGVDDSCAVPETPTVRATTDYVATPSGVALAEDRLYMGDLTAPIIHVVDVTDACDPQELGGLAPVSFEDPSRVVITSKIAVSPEVSPSLKRFLYAIDVMDKSIMVFDVTTGVGDVLPLRHANPEINPLQPPDRVRFAAAPMDIAVVLRDSPRTAGNGIAPFGTLCDPRADAVVCTSTSQTCDLGTLYRNSPDFEDGAGPFEMRGVFAMVALGSGQIAAIDVEDYDQPCRGPMESPPNCSSIGVGGLEATGEPSCGVVIPNTPRAGTYILTNEDVGRHVPGVLTFPVLSLDDGTVVSVGLHMSAGEKTMLVVGGDTIETLDNGSVVDDQGVRNTLEFRLQDPRVHQVDQEWSITYQGALPAFQNERGDLQLASVDRQLVDESAGFCDGGVQSELAVRAQLEAQGLSGAALDAGAIRFADRLHVAQELPIQESTYWQSAACGFEQCRATFGDEEDPAKTRDLRIIEAFDDRLDLAAPEGVTDELFECCFPTLVAYEVRPGDEWIITGAASGFMHNTIADPVTGVCRPSCDPRLALRKSRVRMDEQFVNALFELKIAFTSDGTAVPLQRDMAFQFTSQGSFIPLRGVLTNDDRPFVQPQALLYSRATDDLLISDGGLEGLLIAPGDLNGDLAQFF
ncbi:MAG: hypothetical protein HOV80_20350 [Polyangiaceae bacterium]|nr:hypothetical protein [Polyangiaceae bacterium]